MYQVLDCSCLLLWREKAICSQVAIFVTRRVQEIECCIVSGWALDFKLLATDGDLNRLSTIRVLIWRALAFWCWQAVCVEKLAHLGYKETLIENIWSSKCRRLSKGKAFVKLLNYFDDLKNMFRDPVEV